MDFLTFQSFISPAVLIVFYYLGAIVLPVMAWGWMLWLLQKYQWLEQTYQQGKATFWRNLTRSQQVKIIGFFMVFFSFMELFWRMLFEFLIAYLQMRDALLQMATPLVH